MRDLMRGIPLLAALLLFIIAAGSPAAEIRPPLDSARLQLALDKLNVVGAALYVAAHPDDENTALLAWLANERKVRTGYLSITRGDGGQNLIGPEKGDLLGVIRTQELLAARRIDGAEQFFTRALDFGYTKNAEETFATWNHEEVLSDVVWVVRKFQPDVIVTRFPKNGDGGHGQHTASAILAEEAFHAAADPRRFPEQLVWVRPWQAKRILWNTFRPQLDKRTADLPKLIPIDVGAYNPFLGKAYSEIAADSRSMHKSQGFGSAERRGTLPSYFELMAGASLDQDLFDGVDLTWRRITGAESVGAALNEARASFNPARPSAVVPILVRAYQALDARVEGSPNLDRPAGVDLSYKRDELLEAIRSALGLWIEAIAAKPAATPGSTVDVAVTLVNRSSIPLKLVSVSGESVSVSPQSELKTNVPLKTELRITVPGNAHYSHPYWLQHNPGPGLHRFDDARMVGQPDNPPAYEITANVAIDGETLSFTVPVVYRWTDRVKGEQYRRFSVVPPATADFDEGVYYFPSRKGRPVNVSVTHLGSSPLQGNARLVVPAGWTVRPESLPFSFVRQGEVAGLSFDVVGPASQQTGQMSVELSLPDGSKISRGMAVIDYPHIPLQQMFPAAAARLVRLDVKTAGKRIGYVMGPGDEVPETLRQLGYTVDLLSDEDLSHHQFSQYDAILTGVRAYNTRSRLAQAHSSLLDYVKSGGTLVVQYNTSGELAVDPPGPYPFKVSRDRVTVEASPVSMSEPRSPLLDYPNRITDQDFADWVQERGLYFPAEWDPRYSTVIATNDPGEPARPGSIIATRYGKGTFIYTGLSFFRQLPAGVPGAARLFVNLISGIRDTGASK